MLETTADLDDLAGHPPLVAVLQQVLALPSQVAVCAATMCISCAGALSRTHNGPQCSTPHRPIHAAPDQFHATEAGLSVAARSASTLVTRCSPWRMPASGQPDHGRHAPSDPLAMTSAVSRSAPACVVFRIHRKCLNGLISCGRWNGHSATQEAFCVAGTKRKPTAYRHGPSRMQHALCQQVQSLERRQHAVCRPEAFSRARSVRVTGHVTLIARRSYDC